MIEQLISLGHVTLAAVLGGIVGIEREIQNKPAGFRTNMIIASACALLVILGQSIVSDFSVGKDISKDLIESDPIRIIQAIIIGVSFIGAGSILKSSENKNIYFLTTAATVLLSASVGIAIALRHYVLGVGIVILVLFINWIVKKIFTKLEKNN